MKNAMSQDSQLLRSHEQWHAFASSVVGLAGRPSKGTTQEELKSGGEKWRHPLTGQ
jgi:hypothetical protein